MRSILAVSDLTPASDGTLAAAADLAVRTGAQLHVIHSMELVGMPLWEALQVDVGRRIEDAERALAEQVRRTIPDGQTPASCTLGFHGVRDSVLRRARGVGADLIAFSADRRTAGGARYLRDLQDAAAAASCSVLVLPRTLPRDVDEDGAGAPASSADRETPEPMAMMELAASGD